MGLWRWFRNYRETRYKKKIENCARLVRNPKAIREDRLYGIEFLCDVQDPKLAIPALLPRFEYSLEHGINDAREKEMAMEGILKHQSAGIPYLVEHLKASTRIAWPIKILEKLTSKGEMAQILLDCLNLNDVSFDQAIVDKNYDLLCHLGDFDRLENSERIAHFLNDPDERVRFAAVEVLVRLKEEKSIPTLIESFIFDESAENRRIRATTIEAFITQKWQMEPSRRPTADTMITPGIFITKAGYLERRN